jgi:hypothetical protein
MAKRKYEPPELRKQDIENLEPGLRTIVEEMLAEARAGRRTDPVPIRQNLYKQRRRSTRVPIALSIEIDGRKGLPFRAVTISVNLHGALIRTVKPLESGSTIYIRLVNGHEAAARVVYEMTSIPMTYGIELLEPKNLWGIAHPPEDWRGIAS